MNLKPDQKVGCQKQKNSDQRQKEVAFATALVNLQETSAKHDSLPYSEFLITSLATSALKISQQFPHVPTFAENLMNVLDNEKNKNIIDWNSSGLYFIIKNPKVFIDKVIHQFMKGCKYSSFVRKLYRWGFRQPNNAKQSQCFYNKYFQRGEKAMCKKMRYLTINNVNDLRKIMRSKAKANSSKPQVAPLISHDRGIFANSSTCKVTNFGTNVDKLNPLNTKPRDVCLHETSASSTNNLTTSIVNGSSNLSLNSTPISISSFEETRRMRLEEMISNNMISSLDIEALTCDTFLRSLTSPNVREYLFSLSLSQKVQYFNSNYPQLLQKISTIDKVIQINLQTLHIKRNLQSYKVGAQYCEGIEYKQKIQIITTAKELKSKLINKLLILNLLFKV